MTILNEALETSNSYSRGWDPERELEYPYDNLVNEGLVWLHRVRVQFYRGAWKFFSCLPHTDTWFKCSNRRRHLFGSLHAGQMVRQCFCTSRDSIDRYLPNEDFQNIPYVMGIPFFWCFCVDLPRSFLRTASMRWSSYIHENLGGPSLVKVQSPCLKLAWLSRSC